MKKLLTVLLLPIAFAGFSQNEPVKDASVTRKARTVSVHQRMPQPTNLTPCAGGNVSIPSNMGGISYQWQVNSGSGFSNVTNGGIYSDATTHTLKITGAPTSLYGYQYRCLVDGNYSAVYTLKFVSTWTGAADFSWENPNNWNCNAVPDANTDVIINSGTPILSSNASARTVTLEFGANVAIKNGATLTVAH